MTVKTVGLDLAKDVFQVHGISESGRVIFNKAIKRAKLLAFFEALPPSMVGMEAGGSAHHWGRTLRKFGHDVRLMPANYVKPYVKRGKTDAVDAEAICEAVRRPTMRFVEIKTEDQQAILSIHRMRDLAVRQRTQLANMIRSLLREFGHILPIGIEAVTAFAKRYLDGDHPDMPDIANRMLGIQCYQFIGLNERVEGYSKMIEQHALINTDARRLMRMPGIGPKKNCIGHCRHGRGRKTIPHRARSSGLARTDPAQQTQWRQGAIGQDHKGWRPLHSQASGRGHDVSRRNGEALT
jgi:transposase